MGTKREATNLFLSEFGEVDGEKLSRRAAGLVFLGAVIVVSLSLVAGSGVLWVRFRSIVANGAFGPSRPEDVVHLFGYLPELSHGFFYLVVAPVFVWVGFRFCDHAGSALLDIRERGRLLIDDDGLLAIQDGNRRVFRWVVLLAPALFVTVQFVVQFQSLARVASGDAHILGFVQAPYLKSWESRFARQQGLDGLPSDSIRRRLEGTLVAALPADGQLPAGWNAVTTRSDDEISVDLGKAFDEGVVVLESEVIEPPPDDAWFRFFVVAFCLLEGAFHGFAAWMLVKIVRWFVIVFRLLRTEDPDVPRFEPLFRDEVHHRYGLDALDAPYNDTVRLILLAGFVYSLNYVSNEVKGTFGASVGLSAEAGSMPIGLGVLLAVSALVIGPIIRFQQILAPRRQLVLDTLDAQIGDAVEAGDEDEENRLNRQRETVNQQTTWPAKDKAFRRLLKYGLAFLVLPWVLFLGLEEHLGPLGEYLNVLWVIEQAVAWLSAQLTGIGP